MSLICQIILVAKHNSLCFGLNEFEDNMTIEAVAYK